MSGRGKSRRSLELIDAAYTILSEIQPASVRAVCYRLFTLGIIGSMAKAETNKVSVQLTYARENNLIPWSWIVDDTREAERVSAWKNPAAFVETVKRSYRRDRWADQPDWIEVWSEKATIRGTLAPVLEDYGITFRVMHGYGSATAIHQAATESITTDKLLRVFYVGDWDPRYGWFVSEGYGSRCWELDALSPVILRQRIEQAIVDRLDVAAWNRAEVTEQAERDSLASILNAWPGISGQASKCHPQEPGA